MKRYTILTYNGIPKMREAPDGEYVKYEDAKPNDNLRDEFAMAALTSLAPTLVPILTDEQLARRIYKLADAMLEARNANR